MPVEEAPTSRPDSGRQVRFRERDSTGKRTSLVSGGGSISPRNSRPSSGSGSVGGGGRAGGGVASVSASFEYTSSGSHVAAAPHRTGSFEKRTQDQRPSQLSNVKSDDTYHDDSSSDSPLLSEKEREEIFGTPTPTAGAANEKKPEDDIKVEEVKTQTAEETAKAAETAENRAKAAQQDAVYDAQAVLPYTVQVETVNLPGALPPPPSAVPMMNDSSSTATTPSANNRKERRGSATGAGGPIAKTTGPKIHGRMAGANVGEAWHPGAELIISCVTWNMAQATPVTQQIKPLIKPNAHIICVSTQENGPYVGFNTKHNDWVELIEVECLQERYTRLCNQTLWAINIVVFVRTIDVYPYIHSSEVNYVKTGSAAGLMGNKGGVGASLVLSLKGTGPFKDYHHIPSADDHLEKTALQKEFEEQERAASIAPGSSPDSGYSPREGGADTPSAEGSNSNNSSAIKGSRRNSKEGAKSSGSPNASAPPTPPPPGSTNAPKPLSNIAAAAADPSSLRGSAAPAGSAVPPGIRTGGVESKISLLFIGCHLAAHQKEIEKRNDDFRNIVAKMKLGCRSSKLKRHFLKKNNGQEGELQLPDDLPSPKTAAEGTGRKSSDDAADEKTAMAAAAAATKKKAKQQRDVTEEFDFCFFMGDLNYRINGAKRAIEHIIANHVALRATLVNNDQLTVEMRKGFVFTRFEEGPLCFRPSYKYHIDKQTNCATDDYDRSKKARLPAYCDRVLFKNHVANEKLDLVLTHYTDVPTVRSSDHRPVVAVFKLKTKMCDGGIDEDSCDDEETGCC